jgi:hypothetical protein
MGSCPWGGTLNGIDDPGRELELCNQNVANALRERIAAALEALVKSGIKTWGDSI